MVVAPQTTLDLQVVLTDILQMKAKEFEGKFDVLEKDGKLVVAIHRDSKGKAVWLERHAWTAVNNYARDVGGAYVPREKLWELPLEKNGEAEDTPTDIPTNIPVNTPTHIPSSNIPKGKPAPRPTVTEKEYDLKLSRQKLGALIPILTDAHGNIIDGFHREKIDPDWPRVKNPEVQNPVQLTMARLAANVCRREVPAEEKTKLLGNIAELTGWDAKEIAEALGMSYRWVMNYLPNKYKEKTWKREPTIARRAIAHEPVKKDVEPLIPACLKCVQYTPEKPCPQPRIGQNVHGDAVCLNFEPRKQPFEKESLTPKVPVKQIDTGIVFTCPECGWKGTHIHIHPSGKHKLVEKEV